MKKKEYIILYKAEPYKFYYGNQTADYRFASLYEIISDEFVSGKLIEWFMSDCNTAKGNESVYIRKESGAIALYDVSESMDETYTGEYLDPAKRFEMSVKNFAEIIYQWEELRVSRPDVILIVIHEDNHVSLETDPVIIKQYQDAGYAFDINKK